MTHAHHATAPSTLARQRRRGRLAPWALAALALTGCASTDPAQTVNQAGTQVAGAVTSPLADLNIVHAEIPPVLKAAAKAPYAAPADGACAALGTDVQALDAALGPDLDAPASAVQTGLVERGVETVGSVAVGSLHAAADGVLPFRTWVRKLTGAERYSKQVAAAIAAGSVRRAYLKGLGKAAGCEAPAAPKG
jgi:hypothetical protein